MLEVLTPTANKLKETEEASQNAKAELFVMGRKIKEFAVRFNKT